MMKRAFSFICVFVLFGCGEEPTPEAVQAQEPAAPVLVQTCDAHCQAVYKLREEAALDNLSNHSGK